MEIHPIETPRRRVERKKLPYLPYDAEVAAVVTDLIDYVRSELVDERRVAAEVQPESTDPSVARSCGRHQYSVRATGSGLRLSYWEDHNRHLSDGSRAAGLSVTTSESDRIRVVGGNLLDRPELAADLGDHTFNNVAVVNHGTGVRDLVRDKTIGGSVVFRRGFTLSADNICSIFGEDWVHSIDEARRNAIVQKALVKRGEKGIVVPNLFGDHGFIPAEEITNASTMSGGPDDSNRYRWALLAAVRQRIVAALQELSI